MTEPSQRLRLLLATPGITVSVGVYDCLSAKVAEQSGFQVVFTSGFGISASTLGKPDYGLLTATEVLNSVRQIAQTVSVPVIADLDTGYGNPLNVIRTVQDAIQCGAAGIILEDQEWPKKCGHFDGKRVISCEEQVQKLRAAVHARGDSGLVIIGRTDARAALGLDEAIRRAHAYREAGADVVFIEAPQAVTELETIAKSFPDYPLFANLIEGGRTPVVSVAELEVMGFKLAVFALAGLFAATQAITTCFQHIREQGTARELSQPFAFPEFEELIGVKDYRFLEQRFRSNKS